MAKKPARTKQGGKIMTQEKPEASGNMFERLNKMTRKDCAECGQVFRGLPETGSCLECQYKQDHPEDQDMYWTWKRIGWDGWGIVAHWPDREPLPNPGDQVSVHQKDGSSSTVAILKVRRSPLPPDRAGAAGVHGQINSNEEQENTPWKVQATPITPTTSTSSSTRPSWIKREPGES